MKLLLKLLAIKNIPGVFVVTWKWQLLNLAYNLVYSALLLLLKLDSRNGKYHYIQKLQPEKGSRKETLGAQTTG
jgi:hypothetical protein